MATYILKKETPFCKVNSELSENQFPEEQGLYFGDNLVFALPPGYKFKDFIKELIENGWIQEKTKGPKKIRKQLPKITEEEKREIEQMPLNN